MSEKTKEVTGSAVAEGAPDGGKGIGDKDADWTKGEREALRASLFKTEDSKNWITHEILNPLKFQHLQNVLVDEDHEVYVSIGSSDDKKSEIVSVHFRKNYFTEEGVQAWLKKHLDEIAESLAKKMEDKFDEELEKSGGPRGDDHRWTINVNPIDDGHWHEAEVFIEDKGEEVPSIIGKTTVTHELDVQHTHEIDTGQWGFMTSPGSNGSPPHEFEHPKTIQECLPLEGQTYQFKLFQCVCGDEKHLDLRIETWSKRYGLNYCIVDWKDNMKKIEVEDISMVSKEWFDFEGKIPAGNPGASEDDDATYTLIDSGTVEFGARKTWFHEYFFEGQLLKGKLVFNRQGYEGKSSWWLSQPDCSVPYVLQNKASLNGWAPAKGWSCLPKSWRDLIPKKLHYWENDSPEIARNYLLKRIKEMSVEDEFGHEIKNKSNWEFIFNALSKLQ